MYLIIKTIVTAYYKKSHYKKKMSWMIVICFFTTFLSTLALSIALAVINGFQESTEIKMKGIHSDLTIDGYGNPLNQITLEKTIKKEFKEIEAIAFYSIEQCLISNPHKKSTPQTALFLGIDPYSYCRTHALKEVILTKQPIEDIFTKKKILIGTSMAEALGLQEGSHVDCIIGSVDEEKKQHITFNKEELIVGAIFKTGIEEFDRGIIFGSQETLEIVYPESQITQAGCSVKKPNNTLMIKEKLEKRLSLPVMRWQDYYPAFVSAMALEHRICSLIFILILFMASLINASLLLLYITNKKRDVALLQLLGVSTKVIQGIFIIFGLLIHSVATITGIVTTLIFSYFATYYKIFKLPEAYYIDHVVFSFSISIIFFVLFTSIFTTIITSYCTTKMLNKSKIVDNLETN